MKDRPRALAVLVAVFLSGILIGTAGSYLWFKPSANSTRLSDSRRPAPPPPNRPDGPKFPELNLTPEQEQKFKEIGMETRKTMEAFLAEQRVALDKKRDSIVYENIRKTRAILDEEQRVKYNDWVEKMREWWERAPRHERSEPPRENRRKPQRR